MSPLKMPTDPLYARAINAHTLRHFYYNLLSAKIQVIWEGKINVFADNGKNTEFIRIYKAVFLPITARKNGTRAFRLLVS